MPNAAVSEFSNLLQAELDAEQRRAINEVREVEDEAQRHGAFNGSRRMVNTAVRLGDSVVRYRKTIFEKWTAYIRPRMASAAAADQAEFVAAALRALELAIAGAQNQYRSRPPYQGMEPAMLAEIAKVGAREQDLLRSELNLYLTTPTAPPASSTVNVTTLGMNSPVNVGPGSVNQQINSAEGMGELAAALGALLEAIAQVHQTQQVSEVREVLVEARDEAMKPQPNGLKLRSILAGAKDLVQTLAISPSAWEAVHRISRTVGIL